MSDFSVEQKQTLNDICDKVSKQTTEKIQTTIKDTIRNEFRSYGEDMTGVDITKIEGRKKVRKLYDFTENRYENEQVAKKAFISDGVKNLWQIIMGLGLAMAIYLGWAK